MKRLPGAGGAKRVSIELDGEPLEAVEGEPLATALLASGERVFSRSIKYHRPRGPFCLAGECSHCLMRVDGVPNVFTCQVPARAGARLSRQNAYPSAKVDVFGAIDWLFPRGLDHHEMFAGVPVAEQVMAKVARHLAGLGQLPDEAPPPRLGAQTLRTKVAVVGGGAAGLAAAGALLADGVEFLLLEKERGLGGRLALGAPEEGAPAVPSLTAFPQGAVWRSTTVLGLYEDAQGRYLAAVVEEAAGPRLLRVYAERFLLTVGGHAPLPAFPNNELPGVLSGRAASALVRRDGVCPGEQVVVAGRGPELLPLAALLKSAGSSVSALLHTGPGAAPLGAVPVAWEQVRAHGLRSLRAVSYPDGVGRARVRCDALVVSLPVAASYELPRQGGAEVRFDEGAEAFVVVAEPDGRTRAADLFVAGDATGPLTAAEAASRGALAAGAVTRSLA